MLYKMPKLVLQDDTKFIVHLGMLVFRVH